MKRMQYRLVFALFVIYSTVVFSADRSDRAPLTDSDSSEPVSFDSLSAQSAPARASRGRVRSTTPRGTPWGTPTRSRSKSKSEQPHVINTGMIDDFLTTETIEKNTTLIEKVAKEHALQKSNIYKVVLGLQTFQFDHATIMWANHFFLSVVAKECCIAYFKKGVDIIQHSDPDYEDCIESIRTELNLCIDNAILWPSVERKKDSELYYKLTLRRGARGIGSL